MNSTEKPFPTILSNLNALFTGLTVRVTPDLDYCMSEHTPAFLSNNLFTLRKPRSPWRARFFLEWADYKAVLPRLPSSIYPHPSPISCVVGHNCGSLRPLLRTPPAVTRAVPEDPSSLPASLSGHGLVTTITELSPLQRCPAGQCTF